MYLSHDETWHGVWSVQLLEEGEQDGGAGQAIHLRPGAAGQAVGICRLKLYQLGQGSFF